MVTNLTNDTAKAKDIMLDVILALLPTSLFGIILFGWRAALLIAVCIACSILFEFLCCKLLRRENTIKDLSAALTGLLLALCLPSSLPIWMAVIGCFVAIVVVKQMFGGLGNNFVNPVACARAVLLVSFPFHMSTYYTPFLDATASATPLAITDTSFKELFFGTHGGSIGETSVAMLLIGGLYLFIRGVIKPTIPLAFIGSVAAITYAFGGNGLTAICSGGLILGAIFMATDYVTSPTTFIGKIIFGIGCGTFTFIIRSGNAAEGVCFAILFMNLLVPYIDKLSSLVTSRWEALKK